MLVDSLIELGRDDPALEFPWASEDGSLRYHDLKNSPALIDHITEAASYCELREFLLRVNAPEFPLQTAKTDIWRTNEILPEEDIFAASQKLVSYIDLVFAAQQPRFSLERHQELVTALCSALRRAPHMPAPIEFIIRHCYYHDVAGPATLEDASPVQARGSLSSGLPYVSNTLASNNKVFSAGHLLLSRKPGPAKEHIAADSAAPNLVEDGGRSSNAQLISVTQQPNLLCGFSITVYVSGFGENEQDTRQRWSIALKLLQHAMIQITQTPGVSW